MNFRIKFYNRFLRNLPRPTRSSAYRRFYPVIQPTLGIVHSPIDLLRTVENPEAPTGDSTNLLETCQTTLGRRFSVRVEQTKEA